MTVHHYPESEITTNNRARLLMKYCKQRTRYDLGPIHIKLHELLTKHMPFQLKIYPFHDFDSQQMTVNSVKW